jgi:hypothetical protein
MIRSAWHIQWALGFALICTAPALAQNVRGGGGPARQPQAPIRPPNAQQQKKIIGYTTTTTNGATANNGVVSNPVVGNQALQNSYNVLQANNPFNAANYGAYGAMNGGFYPGMYNATANPYWSGPYNPYAFNPGMVAGTYNNLYPGNPYQTGYNPYMGNPYMTNPYMGSPYVNPFMNPYQINPFAGNMQNSLPGMNLNNTGLQGTPAFP